MTNLDSAAKMKIIVAVEKFKRDLAAQGLDEVDILDALDRAIDMTVGTDKTIVEALNEVADEQTMGRTRRASKKSKM